MSKLLTQSKILSLGYNRFSQVENFFLIKNAQRTAFKTDYIDTASHTYNINGQEAKIDVIEAESVKVTASSEILGELQDYLKNEQS